MNNYFIHFQVDADTKSKIDKYTKEMNITTSKLMRKFIQSFVGLIKSFFLIRFHMKIKKNFFCILIHV